MGFVRGWTAGDLDRLVRLLSSADGALKGVAAACRAARAELAGLRQRAKQEQELQPRR